MNDYGIRTVQVVADENNEALRMAVAKGRENMEQLIKVAQICESFLSPLMLLKEYNVSVFGPPDEQVS